MVVGLLWLLAYCGYWLVMVIGSLWLLTCYVLNDKSKKVKPSKPKKYDDLSQRDTKMSTPLQLRKIEAIWWDICDSAESVKQIRSLRIFIQRQCKIDDIKFLSKREASKLIAVLEKIKSEKLLKAL